MKSKRIGLVLSAVPGYSETFFNNKIKGLQAKGFEVILYVDKGNIINSDYLCKVVKTSDFTGSKFKTVIVLLNSIIKLVFLNPKRSLKLYLLDKNDGKNFWTRLKHLIRNQLLLQQNLDWLHFGFGMLAVGRENVAKAINTKMGVSFRGFDLYLSPLKHPGCYDLLFTKSVQYHVLSNEMKQELLNNNINENDIKVITPAIDTVFFKNDDPIVNTNELKIVTVGRLHWKKGLEYTLHAMSILKKAGVKFKYTIIGAGEERERLVFARHQLDLVDEVCFLGKIPHQQIKHQLENSNIYIQYSIQEGFCNSVLEAQAMRLLCVVSNAEGLSENVLDGQTGWVIPKRNPKLLASKIAEVLDMDECSKQEIRLNAVKRIQNDFGLEKQQLAFVDFFNL